MLFDLEWVFASARLESDLQPLYTVCYIDATHSDAQFHAGEVAAEGRVCFKG